MKRVRPPVALPVSARRTRPQPNLPSDIGIDQNWPGRTCAVVLGVSGYPVMEGRPRTQRSGPAG